MIGFISFETEKPSYSDSNIKITGVVQELFVDEKCRNQGVGKFMLKKVEEYFIHKKIKWIKLSSHSLNDNALNFYKHLGYINKITTLFKELKSE